MQTSVYGACQLCIPSAEALVSDQGELDRLLLTQTQRRKLADDRSLDGSNADAVRFYPIAGDIFVLRYSEIKPLNVSYLSLPES